MSAPAPLGLLGLTRSALPVLYSFSFSLPLRSPRVQVSAGRETQSPSQIPRSRLALTEAHLRLPHSRLISRGG